MKKRGIEKYKTDIEHRKAVKQAIMKKYEEDESYRMRKKAANVHRYNTNENFRSEIQRRAARRYQSNSETQQKMKSISKRSYQSSEAVKKKKKENVGHNRTVKKLKLEKDENVVRQFKEKAMEGPDYVCSCCQRILFRKQVQGCEQQIMKDLMRQRGYQKSVCKRNICTNVLNLAQKCAPNHHYGFVSLVIGKF